MTPEHEAILKDKNLSFMDKVNKHFQYVEERRRTGFSNSAFFLDKWIPIWFSCVFSGAVLWSMFVAIPANYPDDTLWMFITEFFTVYVTIQILINWYLINVTDSKYNPQEGECAIETSDVYVMSSENQQGANGNSAENAELANKDPKPKRRDGLTFRMSVVTAIKEDGVERTSFPYWSWVPCLLCKRPRPPRCHHCTLCQRCVLKRDHHCYFARACVGVNNQRYFIFFLVWSIVITSLGSYQLVPYSYNYIFVEYSYWNLLFPVNLCSAMAGHLPVLYLHYIFVVWGVVFLLFISSATFLITTYLTFRGLTKFEYENGIKITDTRSKYQRLKAVLGPDWGVPLLIPGYKTGDVLEDAVSWSYIKPS